MYEVLTFDNTTNTYMYPYTACPLSYLGMGYYRFGEYYLEAVVIGDRSDT